MLVVADDLYGVCCTKSIQYEGSEAQQANGVQRSWTGV